MRKVVFIFLLGIIPIAVNAQQDVGGFFHGTLGMSIPQGDFASTDGTSDAAGFAKNGFSAYLLFGHKIQGKFGMFGMLMVSANALDSKAMTRELERSNPDYTWKKNLSIWTVGGFTFGPHYSLNLKKWAFDARLMTGALNFISPNLQIEGTPKNGSADIARITQYETRSTSWAWGGGITSKYEYKYGWVLLLNVDYLAGNPKFVDVKTSTEVPTQGYFVEEKIDYRQRFQMLMVSTGVGLVF